MELTLPILTARARTLAPAETQARVEAHHAKLGPLAWVVLDALIGAVIQELVTECWSRLHPRTIRGPWALGRRELRKVVSRCSAHIRVVAATHGSGWTAADVDRELGDDCQAAVLALGRSLTDGEIEALKAGLAR